MDIDLTTGLAKLKTAPTEPPVLDAEMPPEEAFTAVLDSAKHDAPAPDQSGETPLPWPLPLNMQQAPEPTDLQASSEINPLAVKAEMPPAIPAEPQAKAPIAQDMPIQQAGSLPLPSSPESPLLAVDTPMDGRPVREKAGMAPPPEKGTASLPPTLPSPVIPLAPKAKPLPQDQLHIGPLDKQASPDKKGHPSVKPAESSQAVPVAKAPMGLAHTGFATVDAAPTPVSDMPFSLKIDSQPMVGPQVPHPSSTPAPVASQITEQLPHLLSKAEKQTVELRLDPPELGRVTIHITTHDQQVTAHVVADRMDTVDLMRRHAELLTATLARAGFSQADLSFQQGKGQSQQGGFQHFQGLVDPFEGPDQAAPAPGITGLDGHLDIRL